MAELSVDPGPAGVWLVTAIVVVGTVLAMVHYGLQIYEFWHPKPVTVQPIPIPTPTQHDIDGLEDKLSQIEERMSHVTGTADLERLKDDLMAIIVERQRQTLRMLNYNKKEVGVSLTAMQAKLVELEESDKSVRKRVDMLNEAVVQLKYGIGEEVQKRMEPFLEKLDTLNKSVAQLVVLEQWRRDRGGPMDDGKK